MRLKHLLAIAFALYGLGVLVLGPASFGEGYETISWLMCGISLVLALLFLIGRCFFLNVLVAEYVSTTFLALPWTALLIRYIDPSHLASLSEFVEYFTPQKATRPYLLVLLCLCAWFLGLLMAPPASSRPDRPTLVFKTLDRQIRDRSWAFWLVLCVLLFATIASTVRGGWGAVGSGTSENGGLLLWGLADPTFIIYSCMTAFVAAWRARVSPPYVLLLPLAVVVGLRTLMGARSALYIPLLLVMLYLAAHSGHMKRIRTRFVVFATAGVLAVFILGIGASAVRPIWRNGGSAADVQAAVASEIQSGALQSQLAYSVAILVMRVADLSGPFRIINDEYVYRPWPFVNPAMIFERTINDLVPGDVFPGLLTINQLYNYVYQGQIVTYNSENWSVFSLPYFYVGFIGAVVFFFVAGFVVSRWLYQGMIARLRASPAFAVFAITLILEILANGTIERLVVVDIVRVILTSIIFTRAVMGLKVVWHWRVSVQKEAVTV